MRDVDTRQTIPANMAYRRGGEDEEEGCKYGNESAYKSLGSEVYTAVWRVLAAGRQLRCKFLVEHFTAIITHRKEPFL